MEDNLFDLSMLYKEAKISLFCKAINPSFVFLALKLYDCLCGVWVDFGWHVGLVVLKSQLNTLLSWLLFNSVDLIVWMGLSTSTNLHSFSLHTYFLNLDTHIKDVVRDFSKQRQKRLRSYVYQVQAFKSINGQIDWYGSNA